VRGTKNCATLLRFIQQSKPLSPDTVLPELVSRNLGWQRNSTASLYQTKGEQQSQYLPIEVTEDIEESAS
jgi:hypothetical protein